MCGDWFDYCERRMDRRDPPPAGGRVARATSIHDPFPGTPPEGVRSRSPSPSTRRRPHRGRPARQSGLPAQRHERHRGQRLVGRHDRHLLVARRGGAAQRRQLSPHRSPFARELLRRHSAPSRLLLALDHQPCLEGRQRDADRHRRARRRLRPRRIRHHRAGLHGGDLRPRPALRQMPRSSTRSS